MTEIQEHSKYRIKTNDGPVCGYIEKVEDKTYYKFKRIPYGIPPIGPLRFMPPVPIKPWNEELDCTQDPQPPVSFAFYEIMGSEDCLYIEVCAPKNTTDKLLPVMFWIGTFSFAFNIDPILDPKFLVDKNVIFIRCGFRMGPFGFLSINDFAAPGNNGLKDIIMALQWIQRNIECFGGDAKNVTLFGTSSGGSIVHYMTLSPMATGLFHKAIIQSSSAMNTWSLDKNPKQIVFKLAKELNIASKDIIEIVRILKTLPSMDIMEVYLKQLRDLEYSECDLFDNIFKPCIEEALEGIPIFLPKSPTSILKSGMINKVPIIIGAYNTEASVFDYLKVNFYENVEVKKERSSVVMLKSMPENIYCKKIGQKILNFYLDGKESLREVTKQEHIQLMSDYYFLYNINKTVKIHKQIAPECPIYYYIINYSGEWTVPKYLDFFNNSGHAAEIPFLFEVKFLEGGLCVGSRDSIMTRCKVVKMWTNFAKFGNPTPDEDDPQLKITWDPVTSKEVLDYLSINPNLTKGVNPFHDRMAFWEQLLREHKFLRILAHMNDMGVFW